MRFLVNRKSLDREFDSPSTPPYFLKEGNYMTIKKIDDNNKTVASYYSIGEAAKDIKINKKQNIFGTQLNIAWAIINGTKAYQHKWIAEK